MMRAGRLLAVGMVMLVSVVGCASTQRPTVQADDVALPTPLRSYDASVAATIGLLQAAVIGIGSRLDDSPPAYRPSEPETLLQVPRVVMRADLADPGDGFVVIYEAVDASAAEERATELARYLGSGFGQTNYAADTQFSVSVVDDTVIFTTWSRRTSGDSEAAEAVFDAIATVGDAVEVLK